ncbi:hypothetical protein PR048_018275 [Dryococelus australis]|uniref:Uncharacterized protein n=1 Tax=Dryococelus australis TaxID=614101 RepID=A0ABQ9HC00_9NEOP|nr:hypothetical protein PR048_018275 [Dryococelus australis]
METFRPPKELNFYKNAVTNRKLFKQQFEIFVTASGKELSSEARKIAMFLNCIGENALEVYNYFNIPDEHLMLSNVYAVFEEYVKPQESLLQDRIIVAVNDEAIQQRLLRDPELTLRKAMDICRAAEISKIQQKTLKMSVQQEETANVDVVRGRKFNPHPGIKTFPNDNG